MAQAAKRGDTVHVHYRGTLDDGSEFDSSEGGEPISFKLGSGEVIPGFESAIEGMSVGDSKSERIVASDAYGERNDDLIFNVSREQIPADSDVAVGDTLQVGFPDGSDAVVQVTAMDEKSVTLDANHPLAGQALTFDFQLMKIGE